LFAYHLQDGGRAKVQLIQQEGIRVDRFKSERAERSRGEVAYVHGHDRLSACPNCCSDNVPVVIIRQGDPALEFFPSCDQRVVECLAHVGEALLYVNAGVDFPDGFLGLCQDPIGP
jgi:hypothetical protein